LLDPDELWPRVDGVTAKNHLTLPVHDISQPMPGFTHPQMAHIHALIDFGERMRPTIERAIDRRPGYHIVRGLAKRNSRPPSKRATISLPWTGDRPGRRGVISFMVSWIRAGVVKLVLDTQILRHINSLVHAHQPSNRPVVNNYG
jgi:hypothetical protein